MPGLFGFVGDAFADKPEAVLEKMATALRYEEWYQVDLYQTGNIGLGRVDVGLTQPEPQPLWNEERSRCVFMTGELYGTSAMRKQLVSHGRRSRHKDDAELVLHLYEEHGAAFVEQLNGAFAIAIWDEQARKLLLLNDRFGLRPVYYVNRNSTFVFSSGLRAFRALPGFDFLTDYVAMAELLSFEYVLGNRTLIKDAQLLPPASVLTFRSGQVAIQSYWTAEYQDIVQPCSEEEYLEGFLHYMGQAVARQSGGELRKGMLLSGGLDSRLILAYLSDGLLDEPLHTFSFGVPDSDDVRVAREVADVVKTQHHFHELKPDYLADVGDEAIQLTDGMMNIVHVHAYANVRAQAEHVDVIYKGYMGDALLGGHLKRGLWAGYDEDDLTQLMFDDVCRLFRPDEQEKLFSSDLKQQIGDAVCEEFRAIFSKSQATLAANRQNHFDLRQRQRRFILNGVELVRSQTVVRTPFCDKDLVEFMFSVPPGFRLDRRLMILAFAKLFPELAKVPYAQSGYPLIPCLRDLKIRFNHHLRWRLHAAGLKWVSVPTARPYHQYGHWMRSGLRHWVEESLLSDQVAERGYFNQNYVRNLVDEHMAGADHSQKLGMLVTLERWHRQFIDS